MARTMDNSSNHKLIDVNSSL